MKKLLILVLVMLVASVANAATLMHHWPFDEAAGSDTATDSVGGVVLELIEGATLGAAGEFNGALALNEGRLTGATAMGTTPTNGYSIAMWFKAGDIMNSDTPHLFTMYGPIGGQMAIMLVVGQFGNPAQTWTSSLNYYDVERDGSIPLWHNSTCPSDGQYDVPDDEFVHVVAATSGVIGSPKRLWINGVEQELTNPFPPNENATQKAGWDIDTILRLGWYTDTNPRTSNSLLDDLRMYDGVLTQAEIEALMAGLVTASGSRPADASDDVLRDGTVLSWNPSMFAVEHEVYFGDSLEDVNAAGPDSPSFQGGQSETTFPLERLDFGKTYYWRVDAVNDVNPDSPWKGDVWSFEVEPEGLTVAFDLITVSASSQAEDDQGPEKAVNGAGLDADGNHAIPLETMWLSAQSGSSEAWIQLDMNEAVKLSGLKVWNHNSQTEKFDSLGIKEALIEYSADGVTWETFGTVELAKAPGEETYQGTTVSLGGILAQSVIITAVSNWSKLGLQQYGLSEVQLLAIPTVVREMMPADGSTVNPLDAVLSWRAGREAGTHELYLNTDMQAVIDGTAPMVSLTDNSYQPDLDLDSTYYWKVNEVNEAEIPAVWEGPVQSLMTQVSIVVDDMESYKSEDGKWIWETWTDGFEIASNGALLGHGGDDMETEIVHGGSQSLPYYYGQDGAAVSEATLPIDAQDWSKYGIQSLSLYVYGEPTNEVGTFYIKVNDTRFGYQGSASDLKAGTWVAFTIDLENVTSVSSLTIGMEGGRGKIYVDMISLSPRTSELLTAVQPDNTAIVAHYKLDGDAQDQSGNNLHGTLIGSPQFMVDGARGQVVSLNGETDCLDLGPAGDSNQGFNAPGSFSVCAWINIAGLAQTWGHVVVGNYGESGKGWQLRRHSDNPNLDFKVRGTEAGDDLRGTTNLDSLINEWIQVTAVYDTDAELRTVYVNGLIDAQVIDRGAVAPTTHNVYIGARANDDNSAPDKFFWGKIDDVRVYQRALSQAEALGLAGRTAPVYKSN